jgi:hypothetical protein
MFLPTGKNNFFLEVRMQHTLLSRHVGGLLFSSDFEKIVLVSKTMPGFLSNKALPVIGNVAPDQSPDAAIAAAVESETGVSTTARAWAPCGSVTYGPEWILTCYYAACELPQDFKSHEGTDVKVFNLEKLLISAVREPAEFAPDILLFIGQAVQHRQYERLSRVDYSTRT